MTNNSPNGFQVRIIEHNSDQGIVNDLQENIEIRINGQTINKSQFFNQQPVNNFKNELFETKGTTQTESVIDPNDFFGSSFAGLLNQIKKI